HKTIGEQHRRTPLAPIAGSQHDARLYREREQVPRVTYCAGGNISRRSAARRLETLPATAAAPLTDVVYRSASRRTFQPRDVAPRELSPCPATAPTVGMARELSLDGFSTWYNRSRPHTRTSTR